ncbi:hypothetical protein BDB00DRAFT_807759 [Zychaea mexicana]|uniref:uncharacterized protein n=1 Tax=Zychaea mexicana TaxID=64656 RepID=UPI0022FDD4F9|nr:uncharacterized protein BDB00DRAFT_807759 [Zychaea mexicana]KAI9496908.1 hypothetical protein BDB00DRAFT_807759 [Zychaea mexicana]
MGSWGPGTRVLKTKAGTRILFDVASRNLLDEGEQIVCEKGTHDSPRFYCPYKSCTSSFIGTRSIYRHIRRQHDADFPSMGSCGPHTRVLKTKAGTRISFDVASRNLLDEGEQIVFDYRKPDGPRFYCPYKSCTTSAGELAHIYRHIRQKHDADLPSMKLCGPQAHVSKTKAGTRILFDVASKDLLETGEKLQICEERLPPSSGTVSGVGLRMIVCGKPYLIYYQSNNINSKLSPTLDLVFGPIWH